MSDTNCDSRYLVLARMLVTNKVGKIVDVEICSHLTMPMLVHNLLDFASVLRVTHVQNLKHYLKVFIL